MKFSEALGATMIELNITGTALSETSGITGSRLSRFLNGTSIKSDGLDDLLESLDDDVFQYLMTKLVAQRGFRVVIGQPPTLSPTLSKIVQSLNDSETAEMLSALAEKVRKETATENIKKNVLVTT